MSFVVRLWLFNYNTVNPNYLIVDIGSTSSNEIKLNGVVQQNGDGFVRRIYYKL